MVPGRDEMCECNGRVRFGHTGLERHYENNSAFFKSHSDLIRHGTGTSKEASSVTLHPSPGTLPRGSGTSA